MEHQFYLQGIKQCLRAKGITYSELAREMKMTESGVKKMLNAKDISFRRVLKICEVLKVLPGQLFTLSEKTFVPEVRLSPKQEEALLKDRSLLHVYWMLAVEKRQPDDIAIRLGIALPKLKVLLQRLVGLDLASQRKGNYRAIPEGKFRWSDNSKLAKTLNREWSESTLQRALSGKESDALHRLVAIQVSQTTYENLNRKLSETLDEAVRISEREELSVSSLQMKNITALLAVIPKGVLEK